MPVARTHPRRGIGLSLGLALAAGVPAVVLVGIGAVAARAGPASLVVWVVSAGVGLLMAFPFAELVARFPETTGGIAGASAAVLRPRSRALASLVQWSYWLGWSPALAISAALLAEYVHAHALPTASPWTSWLIALGIIAGCALLNRFGARPSAVMQAVLVGMLVVPLAVLLAAPAVGGRFDPSRLSLHLPGGWTTSAGLAALGSALFLAGWSAYGAEVALTYVADYRRGARDAVRATFLTAGCVLAVCAVVPLLLLGCVGAAALARDPAASVLSGGGASTWIGRIAVPVLLAGFLLTLNLISGSDSRVLAEMGRRGDTWRALGRRNAAGAPPNALLFDAAANACYLTIALLLSNGDLAAVPTALLTAASIGYFVSLTIALLSAWLARRGELGTAPAYRAPAGALGLGLGLAGFNVALLVAAAATWGWADIGVGLVVLAAVSLLGLRRDRRETDAVVAVTHEAR